jgi:hypothetical protein
MHVAGSSLMEWWLIRSGPEMHETLLAESRRIYDSFPGTVDSAHVHSVADGDIVPAIPKHGLSVQLSFPLD